MKWVKNDNDTGYPRLCSHRGVRSVMPENTLPALEAAVAMGADEIEFDLRCTKDGILVCIHDHVIDRVSDGTGCVWDMTYEELLKYDFGIQCSAAYKGVKIPTFEEILQSFGGRVIMNIELKEMRAEDPYPEEILSEIVRLVEKYNCVHHVYFVSLNYSAFPVLQKIAPHIPRVPGFPDPNVDPIETAQKFGAKKIQFGRILAPTDEDLRSICQRAHENGLRCNFVLANEPELARHYFELGADTVFTDDYPHVARGIPDLLKKEKDTER